MISRKLLVGFTAGAVVIIAGLGMCHSRGDTKQNLLQPQSSSSINKAKAVGVMQRLIMQMQRNTVGSDGSENNAQPEAAADANQRAEDEQQWQVLDEKRQARIDRLREKQKNIAEAVDRDREEQIGE